MLRAALGRNRLGAALAAILATAGLVGAAITQATAAETRTLRVLVTPVTFDGSQNNGGVDLNARTFGSSTTSLKTFLGTVSGGRLNVTGNVAPWTHVEAANPCDLAWEKDHEPAGYTHYIFVTTAQTCDGNAGFGVTNGNEVWINGFNWYAYAIRHEFGHNLGGYHTTNPDSYDTMGGGCDYQAAFKAKNGWLDNVTTVTAGGRYAITDTHTPSGTALRIPSPETGVSYWVEVRDWSQPPYQWDGTPCSEPQGVVVREVPDAGGNTTLTYKGERGYLLNGEATTLPKSVAQLCVRSLSPGVATVEVSYAGMGLCGLGISRPVLTTSPVQSNDPSTTVTIKGQVPAASMVSIYDGAGCTGNPMATLPSPVFAASGYTLAQPMTASHTFSARAAIGLTNSQCSDPATFTLLPPYKVDISNGVYTLNGTSGHDSFFVWTGPVTGATIEVLFRTHVGVMAEPAGCMLKEAMTASCQVPLGAKIVVNGGGGNDDLAVLVQQLKTTVNGNDGDDNIGTFHGFVAPPSDTGPTEMHGGAGNDTLDTQYTATLFGDAGNDRLVSEGGAPKLRGGTGDDRFEIALNTGPDQVSGSTGTDTVSYAGSRKRVTVTLDGVANDGTSERDNIDPDVENVEGGEGNDKITTTNSDTVNVVTGNGGNDKIKTFGGNDVIFGGTGNDVVDAGAGNDTIDGGAGKDKVKKREAGDSLIGVP